MRGLDQLEYLTSPGIVLGRNEGFIPTNSSCARHNGTARFTSSSRDSNLYTVDIGIAAWVAESLLHI